MHPAWSPDGTKIAYISLRDGKRDIFVVNADGSEVMQLTHTAGFEHDPDWSPDGKSLLFSYNPDTTSYLGNAQAYRMRIDGSHQGLHLLELGTSTAKPIIQH